MKIFIPILTLSLLLGCNSKPTAESEPETSGKVEVGAPAPDFSLENSAGGKINLADYKGKVVLLDFWATWCPPCRMSTPAIVKLNQKFKGKDLAVIGVSLDEDASNVVPPYIKKENVVHTIVYGNDSNVTQDYQVRAIPTFFLLDKKGVVYKQYAGFYPGLEKEWEKEIVKLLGDQQPVSSDR